VALRAFRETDWKTKGERRVRVLLEMADRFEARTPDLVQLISLENGKVKGEAVSEPEPKNTPVLASQGCASKLPCHG